MTSFKCISLFLIALALTGCSGVNDALDDQDSSSEFANTELTDASSKLSATTPLLLRSINASNLSAWVTVDGIRTPVTQSGNGRWLIDIPLEANQSYSLLVEWYAETYLVLEESGTFFTDPANPTIAPELAFLSGGYPRFDADCDGYSNLTEILNETDLLAPPEWDETSSCESEETTEEVELSIGNDVRIIKLFETFDLLGNNADRRLVNFEQRVQIRTGSSDFESIFNGTEYRIILIGAGLIVERPVAEVQFVDGIFSKLIRFKMDNALDWEVANVANASCSTASNDDNHVSCQFPYDWQSDQWYTIQIQEISANNWQASIRPILSGTKQVIANIEIPANTYWSRSQMQIGYQIQVGESVCRSGLPLRSMRFTSAIINEERSLNPADLAIWPCVLAGSEAGEGLRTIDGELVYELYMGSDE